MMAQLFPNPFFEPQADLRHAAKRMQEPLSNVIRLTVWSLTVKNKPKLTYLQNFYD